MQKLLPTNQRGSRSDDDGVMGGAPGWMKITTVVLFIAVIITGITLGGPWAVSDADGDGIPNIFDFIYNPSGLTPLLGEIYPYVEPFASDDTTDIDAAGTYEFWSADGTLNLYEPALTWGTATHTTQDYGSAQTFYFVCKSTTTNAFDHYVWKVTLPYYEELGTNTKDTMLYDIDWDSVNEKWDIHFYCGQEAQPTMLAYTKAGVEVGTTAQDLSDRDYVLEFDLKIAIAANYDCLGYFFDPEEGPNGQWDDSYLIITANVTAANCGWEINGGTGTSLWTVCNDGKSYYMNLKDYLGAYADNGLVVRWDEQQMDGVLVIPITIESTDIDTSGAGACLFTINFQECQDDERPGGQTWESDTDTNLHTAVTAETITVQD